MTFSMSWACSLQIGATPQLIMTMATFRRTADTVFTVPRSNFMHEILFRDGQAVIEVTAYKETSPDVSFTPESGHERRAADGNKPSFCCRRRLREKHPSRCVRFVQKGKKINGAGQSVGSAASGSVLNCASTSRHSCGAGCLLSCPRSTSPANWLSTKCAPQSPAWCRRRAQTR